MARESPIEQTPSPRVPPRGGGGASVSEAFPWSARRRRAAIFAPPWASQLDPGPVNQLYDFYPAHRYPIFACLNRESVLYQYVLSSFVADCSFLLFASPQLYGFPCLLDLKPLWPLSFCPSGRLFPRLFSCEFLNLFGGHGHFLSGSTCWFSFGSRGIPAETKLYGFSLLAIE